MTESRKRSVNLRYGIPLALVAAIAAAVAVPQLASGADHPTLPNKTAAQLLVSLENAKVPDFTGTVVETTRLGLPSVSDSGLASIGTSPGGALEEISSLLSGSHTAQIAYGGPDRQRIAIFLNDLSETDIVHNGADVWTYSSQDNTVSHSRRTETGGDHAKADARPPGVSALVDPQQTAERALASIDPTTAVTVDRTAQVAGRPAYQLVLQPRDNESLVGSVRIAIDSATTLPLRVEIWPRASSSSPALEVTFTTLHVGTPAASTFDFTSPPGAKVISNPLVDPKGRVQVGPGLLNGHSSKRAPRSVLPGSVTPATVRNATSEPDFRVVGKGWLRVLVGHVQAPTPDSNAPPSTTQMLAGLVNSLSSRVTGGRLVHTPLFSVLLTNEGRMMFVGAVSPAYLEHLAADGAHR